MTAAAIREALLKTNRKYLWNREGQEYTTTQECEATTCGAVVRNRKGKNPEFISCCVGSTKLPVGTKGLVFIDEKIGYSKCKWVGDMSVPVPGADIIKTGAYYTFVTLVTLETGDVVVADSFKEVTHDPKVIGTVN